MMRLQARFSMILILAGLLSASLANAGYPGGVGPIAQPDELGPYAVGRSTFGAP